MSRRAGLGDKPYTEGLTKAGFGEYDEGEQGGRVSWAQATEWF